MYDTPSHLEEKAVTGQVLPEHAAEEGGVDPTVTLEVRGDVLVVSINRPEVLNAVDQSTAELLARAFTRLDEEDTVRVGVLSGGPKAFSTGADLRAVAAGQSPVVPGRGFGGL